MAQATPAFYGGLNGEGKIMKTVMTAAVLLLTVTMAWGFDAGSSCVSCHGDEARMKVLGSESMYLDPAQVDRI